MSAADRTTVMVAAFLAVLTGPAQAQIDELFRTATARLHEANDLCAFTVVTTSEEETLVERFDPSRPEEERWQLLEVDGEIPSKKRRAKYHKQKQQQRERNGARGFDEMLDEGTVEQVEDSATEAVYEFRPIFFEDEPEKNENFVGRVVINKADATIREMEYYITDTVKPVAVVTIEKMHAVMKFTSLPDGEQVPASSSTYTRGKALAFKKFDQTITREYSDYSKVIP